MDELNIGDGATYTSGSDRYPATVVGWNEFKSGKQAGEIRDIIVQTDRYEAVSGQFPDFTYAYTQNPDGRLLTFRKNGKGQFVSLGGGSYLHVGQRRYYNDPHF
jgi:hypothetical protein